MKLKDAVIEILARQPNATLKKVSAEIMARIESGEVRNPNWNVVGIVSDIMTKLHKEAKRKQ